MVNFGYLFKNTFFLCFGGQGKFRLLKKNLLWVTKNSRVVSMRVMNVILNAIIVPRPVWAKKMWRWWPGASNWTGTVLTSAEWLPALWPGPTVSAENNMRNSCVVCVPKYVRIAETNVPSTRLSIANDVQKPVNDVQRSAEKWRPDL